MRRVLKPGGRVLAVDFATPARERKGLLARFHRHGHLGLNDMVALLSDAGLRVNEIGTVGVSDLHFVLASAQNVDASRLTLPSTPTTRSLPSLPTPHWVWAAVIVCALLAHGIIIRGAFSRLTVSVLTMTGLVVLFAAMHSGFLGVIHSLLRRRKR